MRIDKNFKLRQLAGENIIVQQGKEGSDLTKIISLNSSAHLLYEKLLGKEFTAQDAAAVLVENYGIDQQRADTDAAKWIESLKDCKVIVD